MIPIEYLWYIIGAVVVPVFIKIYLRSLNRNRKDKARVARRRKRFERMMKSASKAPGKSTSLKRAQAKDQPADRAPAENPTEDHWLRGVKLPTKKEHSRPVSPATEHWLEHLRPKHWLHNLKR